MTPSRPRTFGTCHGFSPSQAFFVGPVAIAYAGAVVVLLATAVGGREGPLFVPAFLPPVLATSAYVVWRGVRGLRRGLPGTPLRVRLAAVVGFVVTVAGGAIDLF